jgi:hypothetical protein
MTSKRCTFQGGEIALGVFKHPFVSVLRRAKLKRCRATTRMALARNESKRPWPRFRLPQLVIGSPRDLSKELDVNGKFQRSENQKSSLIILSIKKPKSYQKHPVLPPILAKTSPFIPFHPLPIHPSVPLKPGQSPNSCFPARSLVAIELGLW